MTKEGRCGGRLPGVSCLALYHVGLSLFLKSTYDYFVKDKLTDLAKNGRIWSRMERLADLEQTVVTITKELKWKGSWKKRWNDNDATLTCGCCMYLRYVGKELLMR